MHIYMYTWYIATIVHIRNAVFKARPLIRGFRRIRSVVGSNITTIGRVYNRNTDTARRVVCRIIRLLMKFVVQVEKIF